MPCGRTVSAWPSVRDAGRTRPRRAAALARHVQKRGQSVRSGCQGLGRGGGARGCERGCRRGDGMFWSYTEEMVAGHCGCTQCHLSSTLKWFLLFYANPTSIETEQRRQKEVWLWASAQTGRSAGRQASDGGLAWLGGRPQTAGPGGPRATVSCTTAPPPRPGDLGLSLRALCRSRSRWRRPGGAGWGALQQQRELGQAPPRDPGMRPGPCR